MKRMTILSIVIFCVGSLHAENYLINGGQKSTIKYQLAQRFQTAGKTKVVKMSFVVPESYSSPTYNQKITDFKLEYEPTPSSEKEERDARGNRIIRVEWKNPKSHIDTWMFLTATNETRLQTLQSSAPYPLTHVGRELAPYLQATEQVQSNDPGIKAKSQELVRGVTTEFDAVQRILTWVVDNMRYVTPPKEYDALYSFKSGKGNCQNYSHLSAALMRQAGIPVRIVNGVTLKEPYTVKTGDGEFTFKMGQGRHSWIEVWFGDLGWVPFDPQQTELYVSNRFVRIEVGVDNKETVNDGMVKWQQGRGVSGRPRFQEAIEADFVADQVNLTLEKQNYGPQKMLICPRVEASFQPVVVKPPPPPVEIPEDKLEEFKYDKPYLFGNLDYPAGYDFATARGPAEQNAQDEYALKKNFMVETAEYVTTKLTQYAQIFVLDKPLKLLKSSLALHPFGGSGQLWLEVMEDNGGKPGRVIATSDFISLAQLSKKPGYDWVDFDFSKAPPKLSPGSYWIALGFTGSPIVNWFYTYGKSVGPVYGTRYKGVYDSDWSGALSYEFNYRVAGFTTR